MIFYIIVFDNIRMELQSSSTYRSMRSSLYPFIQDPLPDEETNSAQTNVEDSQRKLKSNLLERYHDASYIVKPRPPTKIQKYIKILNAISKKFMHQEYQYASKQQESLTFDPQATPLYIWNIFVFFSIIYHFFQIPICLFFTQEAFHSQFRSGFGITCNVVSLIVLLINIIYVTPNTQYYHNGFLVTRHQKIIQRYIGWRIIIDSIAYISLFIFVVSYTYHLIYLKIFFYLMVYRLSKIDDLLARKIQLTKVRLAGYKLLRIIIFMLFLVLWLASIFFAIDYHYYLQGANANYSGTQLWLTASTATNSIDIIQGFNNWAVWLDYALYWSFQTVSMVGFGDLTPKNPVQVTFTSIVITCVVVSFAFFITGVWEIVAQARQHQQFQNNQWKVYKEYQKQNMKPLDRSKQVSQKGIKYRQLKNKVGSYLFQMWSNQKANSQINIVEVLQKSLTPQLKDQVFINYRKNLFERIDLFQQLQQTQAKNYKYIFILLIFKITQKKYAKQQTIIQAGKLTINLIYLVNGKLTIQYPNSNYRKTFSQNVTDLKDSNSLYVDKNSNFGVKHFFTQQGIPYSVISESFCKTSQLSMQDFIRSVKEVDQFYIKYCELRDRLKLYNIDSLAGEQCIQCGSNDHQLSLCEQCDISMCYKRHWMKINLLKKKQLNLNKQKTTRVPIRRKDIKSVKIMNLTHKKKIYHQIDEIRNFNFYEPQHNLMSM